MGARSRAAARGPRAPRAAQLMLPPFHGDAHARVRGDRARGRRARGRDAGRRGEPFALHPRMQAITLEVILRAVFGVDRPRPPRAAGASGSRGCWPRRRPPGCSSACCSRGGSAAPDPLARLEALRGEIDALLAAEIAERRAEPGRGHPARCSSRPASRTASRWTTREIRDQLMTLLLAGHETTATGAGVDVRPAAAPPARRSQRLVAEVDAGERRLPARGRRRVAAAAPGRAARRPPAGRRAAGRRPRAARRAPT